MIIKGSLDNLQSSLDFYLSITSKNLIVDLKEMKKRFFEIFKEEDSYRKENFLMFQERVSDDYAIAKDVEPVLVGEEECFAFGNFSFAEEGGTENDYPSDSEVYISSEEGYEDDEEDEFISYGTDSDDLENENSSFHSYSSSLEIENTELDNENMFFEEENCYSEKENISLENETSSLEIERNNLEIESEELDDDDFIDYSSSENENASLETEKTNPFSEIDEGIFYDSEISEIEEDEEEFSWGSYDESEYSEDEVTEETQDDEEGFGWGSFDDYEYTDNEVKEGSFQDSSEIIEEKSIISDDSAWGNFDVEEFLDDKTSLTKENKVVEEKPKNRVVEVEEEIEVPRDLRDFVKLYHNCEMSFALQYFTKKEIDKQLSLGRVFKRKNRLLI